MSGGSLTRWQGGGLSREAKRAAHTIGQLRLQTEVRIANVDAETDVAVATMDALSYATATGMVRVTRTAQLQQHLELLAPAAAARLNYLAEDHAFAMAEASDDLRRRLRRR